MSLSRFQKDFLKTIENPKYKKYQKQQFKLQNKFYKFGLVEEIIFIDGIFKTDNPELIAFFNECPMVEKIEENSLTKESLRDITEPKTEIDRTKTHSLVDLSCLTDLSIQEVNKCLIMTMQLDAKPWEHLPNILMNRFITIKERIEDEEKKGILSKTDKENIPKEFCVEITEENKEVLERVYKQDPLNLIIGKYIISFEGSNEIFNYPEAPKNKPIVSTEEFLRYIGKEEYYKISTHIGNIVTELKKEVLDKPLDFDLPKKENQIQNIECLSINDIVNSGVLIVESPLCQKLKDYLLNLVSKKTNPLKLQ